MACYKPLTAYQYMPGYAGRKVKTVVFDRPSVGAFREIRLPCGQCIGCRLKKSLDWAIRCEHEMQLHDASCFLTLTFSADLVDDKSLLVNLEKDTFQRFMKRLRKEFGRVRYYHCGEYGDIYSRPHHHCILFGCDFSADRVVFRRRGDVISYISPSLTRLWPYGYHIIEDANFDTAAYVSRYVTKKLTGDMEEVYHGLQPPYATMSLKPGIGYDWVDKYESDIYPSGKVVTRAAKIFATPKSYDLHYAKRSFLHYNLIKELHQTRLDYAIRNPHEFTSQRLAAKERFQELTHQFTREAFK